MVAGPFIAAFADDVLHASGILTGPTPASIVLSARIAAVILMFVTLAVLVTGPVYGGTDKSGRWPTSTKGLVIGWTFFAITATCWGIYHQLASSPR